MKFSSIPGSDDKVDTVIGDVYMFPRNSQFKKWHFCGGRLVGFSPQ